MSENTKKPIWKRWWVWVIVILIIIIASSGGNNDNNPDANPSVPAGSTGNQNTDPPAQPDPKPEPEPAVKSYKAGMYKVGTDLPAAEYVLVTNQMAYFEIAKDSNNTLDSIIANDNFSNRSIVTVSDGQYLTIKNATAYAFADAPKVEPKDGMLPDGMYKVGVDLSAGEYKVSSNGMGYVEVSSNSKHILDSIVSNDNFDGEKYVTVKDGQYIKLARASIKVN